MRRVSLILVLTCAAASRAAAQHHDSAFAAMQERGKAAMGVDQYASTHRFDGLKDGGRIELVRNDGDSADVARIRAHMREISRAFASGDFSTPAAVHLRSVPGADVMTERRRFITYEPHDIPRGAELRIRTDDPEALRAIHRFMVFQRDEHHAGGKP
jgi:DNA-binding GntR family transcriptional regulator